MRRSDLPATKAASYVLPHWRTVYVSVPKAACTSLKWLVADLQGESRERLQTTLSREVSRTMTVHRRSRWQHTPTLHSLSDQDLEKITPDDGWFVFTVVRHPAARLWSAWQSKLLLQDPRFREKYPEGPWPRIPSSTSEVVEDFHDFVRRMDEEDLGVVRDRHFRPQAKLARVERMPYSRIYKTSQIPELLDDLEKHLRPQGLERMPNLLRSNESPLPALRSLFTPEVRHVIARHYAMDFDRFGYEDVVPESTSSSAEFTSDALEMVGRTVEHSQRIADLHDIAVHWREQCETQGRPVGASGSSRVSSAMRKLVGRRRRG